jgi:gliding motility-associated-like protein
MPWTYSWIPTAPNSATITNLTPGGYTLTLKDGNGCTHTNTTTIIEPASMTATINSTPINCNGGISGATVNVGGGSPAYSYTWLPTPGTNSFVNNIVAGSYSVTIKDANNCSITKQITITEPSAIQANISVAHVSCNSFSNGAATSAPSGGTPAFTFTWLPMNTNFPTTSSLTAGTYTLKVKDTKSCSITQTFVVNQPLSLTYTANTKDEFCVNADGSATLTVAGGTGPYGYSWNTSPAQTGSVAVNMVTGTYTATVTDAKSCTLSAGVTIGNQSNLNASISSKADVTCFGGCNGAATAAMTGGNPPFAYVWPAIPSATSASVNNLCAGSYTVKITDILGCYTFTSVTITEPPALTYTPNGTSNICSGKSSTLTSNATGGTPAYVYNWQPGNLGGASAVVNPTVSTSYTLTVTDSKGCSGGAKLFNVLVKPPISLNAAASSKTVCPNVNATVNLTPTGGDGNYSYLWNPGGITSPNITVNLQSTQVYSVMISDGCGSTPINATVGITVHNTQPPVFTVSDTMGCQPLCVQFKDYTAGAASILWIFGDFSEPGTGTVTTHCYSKGGTYSVTVIATDANGCKATVKKNDLIEVFHKPIADYVQKPLIIDLNTPDGTFLNSSVYANEFSWELDGNLMTTNTDFGHSFFEEGCYDIKLIARNDNDCADTTARTLCVTEGFNFWAANAFTPDGDGHNDIFIPKGTGWVAQDYKFEVADRWGITIYNNSEPTQGWDGTYRGTQATDDVYLWYVHVVDIYGKEHDYKGKLVLIR